VVSNTRISILSVLTGHKKQQKAHCAGLHMPGGQHSISSLSQVRSFSAAAYPVSHAAAGNGKLTKAMGVSAITTNEKRSAVTIAFIDSNVQKISRQLFVDEIACQMLLHMTLLQVIKK
jgi:hypothetical protein